MFCCKVNINMAQFAVQAKNFTLKVKYAPLL